MWYNKYVGLPYKEGGRDFEGGFDCWGLVRQVILDQTGKELPRLDGVTYNPNGDKRELLKAISEYTQEPFGWKRLTNDEKPCIYNVIWLRNGGPIHFGVMIDDKRFLHIEDGCDSVIEKLDSPRWNRKIRGFFKHV